jgi:drug/metabolite transporter (DMT)-like permease
MLILLLCIFCNVLLTIIFKYFVVYKVDNLNAIIVNYFMASVWTALFMNSNILIERIWTKDWFLLSLLLGVLFIVGFNIMALSLQKAGVALTVIIQKMSLVLPAAFAIAFFDESLHAIKLIGIITAIVAIVLVNYPSKKDANLLDKDVIIILLPLLTFLLSGLIEILMFYAEASGKMGQEGILFTTASFGLAGIMGLIFSMIRSFRTGRWWSKKDVIGGVVLSIPNYFTIYLVLVLLAQGWDGSVLFPMNNIGILIGASLVGLLLFREKLNNLKMAGLGLGAVAILLIGLS